VKIVNKKHYTLALFFILILLFIFIIPKLTPDTFDHLISLYAQEKEVLADIPPGASGFELFKYLFKLDIFMGIFSQIVGAFSLLGLLYQFGRERDVNQAEFVLNLNDNFISNSDLMKIYKKLEKSKENGQEKNPFSEDDLIDMANYLSFFEAFYELINRKVIKIPSVDHLAYRFFLATNNKYMQKMLLCKEGKDIAWKDLYKLHKLWKNYREKKNNDKIWQNEYDLSNYEKYEEIVK